MPRVTFEVTGAPEELSWAGEPGACKGRRTLNDIPSDAKWYMDLKGARIAFVALSSPHFRRLPPATARD